MIEVAGFIDAIRNQVKSGQKFRIPEISHVMKLRTPFRSPELLPMHPQSCHFSWTTADFSEVAGSTEPFKFLTACRIFAT